MPLIVFHKPVNMFFTLSHIPCTFEDTPVFIESQMLNVKFFILSPILLQVSHIEFHLLLTAFPIYSAELEILSFIADHLLTAVSFMFSPMLASLSPVAFHLSLTNAVISSTIGETFSFVASHALIHFSFKVSVALETASLAASHVVEINSPIGVRSFSVADLTPSQPFLINPPISAISSLTPFLILSQASVRYSLQFSQMN